MKTRVFLATALLLTAGSLSAGQLRKSFRDTHDFTLVRGGSFVIENPVGNVEIIGSDEDGVHATAVKTIVGADAAAIADGNDKTALTVGGDDKTRVLRAVLVGRSPRWTSSVSWKVRVPRTAFVRVVSSTSDRLAVTGVSGNVYVKNFNGLVVLQDVTGPASVESVNGSIIYRTAAQPGGNVTLTTVNGAVTASVNSAADLRWVAETVKGDIRTTLPVRGAFIGQTFRGSVNAPGGPTITTVSLMGDVFLIAGGTSIQKAASIRSMKPLLPQNQRVSNGSSAGAVQQAFYQGLFRYSTNLGDVRVQEIRGDADIFTGAGEVQLGLVNGDCSVHSRGGPLQLGEILGTLVASTGAGDVLVDSARQGGVLSTSGGTVRLLYTAGPTQITSGGGDIVVRQAAGPIHAETKSGDVSVAIDARSKTQKLDVKTENGNIVINVPAGFHADVDATILTRKPNADTIVSDIPGLSFSRRQVGGRTQIHATGKINGGGEKVVLQATDGDIRITTAAVGPTVVKGR